MARGGERARSWGERRLDGCRGMSLKAFHIFFVTLSTLLALGFGAWAIRDYRTGGAIGSLVLGVASLVCSVVLVLYGRWFLNKLKGESYL